MAPNRTRTSSSSRGPAGRASAGSGAGAARARAAGPGSVSTSPFEQDQALDDDAVLELQRAAGNHAVSDALQRAPGPLDDTWPGVALADTAPGVGQQPAGGAQGPAAAAPVPAGASTAVGSVAIPASPQGPGATSQPADPSAVIPIGGGGPVGLGGPVPEGQYANVDQGRRRPLSQRAVGVPEFVAESQYAADPSRVFRSPSDDWHYQMWNFQKGPGYGDEPPTAFRVGNLIAVAPGYQGHASPIPSYSGDEGTGLGVPGPQPAGSPGATTSATTPTPERPFSRAIFPGFVPGPEPANRQVAAPATDDEVAAALASDPRRVIRSPNAAWHAQGYELDQGAGATPRAYRVENVIMVAPDYPTEGLPAQPVGTTPAGPAGATTATGASTTTQGPAGTPMAPATTPAPTTSAGATASDRRVVSDLKATEGAPGVAGELGVEQATTSGDTTRTTKRGATGSIGGDSVASIGGQHVDTTATGDASTVVKTAGNLTIKPEGALALGGERTREQFQGTDAAGEPIKTGATSTFGGLEVSEKGVAANAGRSQTNAAGTKRTTTAGASIDSDGNVSGSLGHQVQTKGGTSFTTSVSGGMSVVAGEPMASPNGGFDVAYTLSDSSALSLGAGQQMGSGGPSVGVQVGSTSASLETGTRHFADVDAAKAFRADAAAVIVRERMLRKPPTTVQGALEIPIGEERGTGDVSGSSIGGSVSLEGASVGYGRSSSTTNRFTVKRLGETTFLVTGSVSGTKGSDWSISGGLSNTKGSSETKGFEVAFEFDLAEEAGRDAFELYARTGIPPMSGATLRSITTSGSGEDHDNVSIPLLGTAKWTGTAWEVVRQDAGGGTQQEFGGQQAHDQDPGWVGRKVFGEDRLHSSAQIVSSLVEGTDGRTTTSYQAQVKVSGDSGDYNREELGKIFMGARNGADAKPSGEWTLTAEVSPAVIRELEQVHTEMRQARTTADKMRIYSKLVKERGAAMVGAQVGLGGDATAWTVELKGDANFPGEAGRRALDAKRAELKTRMGTSAADARSVVDEAKRVLEGLDARRAAVADRARYTDLPDGMRQQQLTLIDQHKSEFRFLRDKAGQEALKVVPGETIETVRARLADTNGYAGAERSGEGAEMARLRDRIADKEASIKEIDPRILEAIEAVQRASSSTIAVPQGYGRLVAERRADYNTHWDLAVGYNDRQWALKPKADGLRTKLLEATAATDRKATAEQLLAVLDERRGFMGLMHDELVSAAEALKSITTSNGMKGHETFWAAISSEPLDDD